MRTLSMLTIAGVAAAILAPQAQAGLIVTNSTTTTAWPNPAADGGAINTSTQTTADPTSGTVANTLSAGGVTAQSFTSTSSYTLGDIAIVASGAPAGLFSIHLFALNSTYHPATDGGYTPSTAFSSGDLLGGGAGLAFTYSGSGGSVLNFDLTGVDQVALTGGTSYAFELWADPASTQSLFWQRSSTDVYAGGSMFAAGAGTGVQSGTSTAIRGNVSGAGLRDGMFATYAAPVTTPEPATIAALGLGVVLIARRRRRS